MAIPKGIAFLINGIGQRTTAKSRVGSISMGLFLMVLFGKMANFNDTEE